MLRCDKKFCKKEPSIPVKRVGFELKTPRQTSHFQTFKNSDKLAFNEGLRENSATVSEGKWFR